FFAAHQYASGEVLPCLSPARRPDDKRDDSGSYYDEHYIKLYGADAEEGCDHRLLAIASLAPTEIEMECDNTEGCDSEQDEIEQSIVATKPSAADVGHNA
ncbi:MAG: hypothetical protein K2J17_00810, partial [Paramuribaculum sp.]|nr:hypothetical protein [Paramuribaculum sp.]